MVSSLQMLVFFFPLLPSPLQTLTCIERPSANGTVTPPPPWGRIIPSLICSSHFKVMAHWVWFIISELPLNLLNIFLVPEWKSLPPGNAWPISSSLSLQSPFCLRLSSYKMGASPGMYSTRQRKGPDPWLLSQEMRILSHAHPGWPSGLLPVRLGWWHLP